MHRAEHEVTADTGHDWILVSRFLVWAGHSFRLCLEITESAVGAVEGLYVLGFVVKPDVNVGVGTNVASKAIFCT